MQHWILSIIICEIFLGVPKIASAELSGLVPCKESLVFKKRLESSVKKTKFTFN
jgi:hypothetical protein